MRVVVTGTPGTGKTTATGLLGDEVPLEPELDVLHLNEAISEHELTETVDEDRESLVADMQAVADYIDEHTDDDEPGLLVESHLAHQLDADLVVVLRAHPETVAERLAERGESEASVRENAESEALDVVLSEAVQQHGVEHVHEIDTTMLPPEAVAREIAAAVAGEREPRVGTVDFSDYLADPDNFGTSPFEDAGAASPPRPDATDADGGDGDR